MSANNSSEVIRGVLAYFERKDPKGEIAPHYTASFGFRFGMAVALRHPEYAQAYARLIGASTLRHTEGAMIDAFVKEVPIKLEGEPDVVSPSQR